MLICICVLAYIPEYCTYGFYVQCEGMQKCFVMHAQIVIVQSVCVSVCSLLLLS